MINTQIHAGTIIGAVGIKGYVRVKPFFSDIKNISNIEIFTNEKNIKSYEMHFIRSHNKNIVVKFNNINDRNQAERLIGAKLFINKDSLTPLKKGEYYLSDLIGFSVKTKNKNNLGKVKSIKNFGAGDLIEVLQQNKKTFFLPMNKENIKEVNLITKIILIDPIKGIIPEK